RPAVADFNGDGRPDLVIAHLLSDEVSVLLGNGDGTFRSERRFALGTRPASWPPESFAVFVYTADINGDGCPDLVTSNGGIYVGDHCNSVSVLLGNGDGSFQRQRTLEVINTGGSFQVTVADVNGDGRADVVGYGWVLLGNGDGSFQPVREVVPNIGGGP